MTALPVMTELGRGLGWRGKILAMLWIHLDESGEHDSGSGHLKRLAIAGGIAPFESWEILSLEWSAILEAFYIPMFHMADFESREATPFKGWSEEKRRLLLSGLLDVAVRHIPFFFGTVTTANIIEGTTLHYSKDLIKIAKELWNLNSPITVILAAHKEIKAEFIGKIFDLWSAGSDELRFGGFADPRHVCPLQVADIVAYELCRAARSERPTQTRYPLMRLKERPCFLLHAETLGVVEL